MHKLSYSPAQTIKLGEKIGRLLKKGDIVCLFGMLGSGKTVLVKGLAKGAGVDLREVISPSFVIIREYAGRFALYHFDLYRLDGLKDIADLGYEEYFYGAGVSVIEWADRLKKIMPPQYLKIELEVKGKKQRLIKFSAVGKDYSKLIRKINENTGG